MPPAGGEQGTVPVGERASRGVRREIRGQPDRLRVEVALAVQGHDVPAAEVVTVPPAARRAGTVAEVGEVRRPVGGAIVVIAG